jgi:8-oxo-dGTP pyrophosphatase MutT (NUDIX family)
MAAPRSLPLAVDDRGNALVSFVRAAKDKPPGDAPLPLALVTLWHGDRVLMVFDRSRQTRELPGGQIDPGETPRRAAARELPEETGHVPEGRLQPLDAHLAELTRDGTAEDSGTG